jgi:hypothetical protein
MELTADPQVQLEHKNNIDRLKGLFRRRHEALIVLLGTFLTDFYAHQAASMQTGAGIIKHIEEAVPSAMIPAKVSPDLIGHPSDKLDLAIDVAPLATAAILAKGKNTTTKDMILMLGSAQALATAADVAVVQAHLISAAEKSQADVGSSALTISMFTKYLFDKMAQAETKRERSARRAIAAIFVGSVTIGAAFLDSRNFTTNLSSHTSGALVGAAESKREQKRQQKNNVYRLDQEHPKPALSYDATTEALAA